MGIMEETFFSDGMWGLVGSSGVLSRREIVRDGGDGSSDWRDSVGEREVEGGEGGVGGGEVNSFSVVRKSIQWHSFLSRIGTQGQFQYAKLISSSFLS